MNKWPGKLREFIRQSSVVFVHETRVLLADRTLWLTSALLIGLLGYALYNGVAATQAREALSASILKKQADQQRDNINLLARIMAGKARPEPFSNPADPASVGSSMGGRYAVLPATVLSPFAIGQSDMFSHYYQVTYRSKLNFIYDTEIENPWNLLSGHFDLAFVLIYLLPLIIFALSYNLLSSEREQGTLRMLLSQPLGLPTLVLAKLAVRAIALIGLALAIPILALLLTESVTLNATALTALFCWATLVTLYGLFWFGLASSVNALGRSSASNALMLIGSWVLLVLVMPVLLNLFVGTVSPAPSRTELATRARLITIDSLNKYNKLLSTDYRYTQEPDVLMPKNGKIEVPPRRQGAYLMQRDMDAQIQPELDKFDAQLAAQQVLVDRYSLLSPAIVAHEGMSSLAGNGSRRYLEFQRQVGDFHQSWKQYFEPRMLEGTAITEADFKQMPSFSWNESTLDSLLSETLIRLIQLLGLTAALALFTAWRVRRYAIV